MKLEPLSEQRKRELIFHLGRRHPKFRVTGTALKIVDIVNSIRTGQIKDTDWVPKYENILRYEDMIESMQLEKFLK